MDYYERSFFSIWFVYYCIYYHLQTCQTLIKENQETYEKKRLENLQKVVRFYFSPDQD